MSQHNGQTVRIQNEHPSAGEVVGNVTDVMHDVTELAELQAKLLATDSKAALRRAILPTVSIVVGVCLVLGSIPVALLTAAEVIEVQAEVSRSIALGIAAGAGVVLAILLLILGWWRLRKGFTEFERSRTELSQNIAWIKQTLRNARRPAPPLTKQETLA